MRLLLAPGEAEVFELEHSQQHGAVGWERTSKTWDEATVESLTTQQQKKQNSHGGTVTDVKVTGEEAQDS